VIGSAASAGNAHSSIEDGLERLAWELHDALDTLANEVLPSSNRSANQASS
jgi:hypothetical protein